MESGDYPGRDSTVRDRIEWARLRLGMRKSGLAAAIDASPSRVSEWTRGADPVTPKAESLQVLAEALGVDVGWLSHGYGSPNDSGDEGSTDGALPVIDQLLEMHAAQSGRQLRLERLVADLLMVVTSSDLVPADDRRRLRDALSRLEGDDESPASELRRAAERAAERRRQDDGQQPEDHHATGS